MLPIGRLKEKLLAALRGGIKKVLIPEENVRDLKEIPANVKEGLESFGFAHGQVLEHALGKCRGDRMELRGGRSQRRRLPPRAKTPVPRCRTDLLYSKNQTAPPGALCELPGQDV